MMPSYDDDRPTFEEENLCQRLKTNLEEYQQIQALIQLKNSIIGSKRSKSAFYHVGILEILSDLLKEYSSPEHRDLLIELLDCLSSFAKSPNEQLFNRLIDLAFIEQLLHLLTFTFDSSRFYESLLQCLRTFYLPKHQSTILTLYSSNEYRTKSIVNERSHSIDLLFEYSHVLPIFTNLLSISQSTQISIIEILCCACVNNDRQNEIIEQNYLPRILDILIDNLDHRHPINEYLLRISLKFFCSISFENPPIAEQLSNLSGKNNRNLSEIISGLLHKIHRPLLISYYSSKYFIHLCKSKVLPIDDPTVANQSLTTLIHLCIQSSKTRCVSLYIECLHTLIYFLNGNYCLHHYAMYTEQFLKKLFVDIINPRKIFGEDLDANLLEDIRAALFTFMAILSSYHEDIKKRIAEQESLISLAIECYRSSNLALKLSTLRLFHGLSRSVQQLRTTFNDSISDILLDAIQSKDFLIVHTASSVISNSVLEFSTCRERLLAGGILDILFSLITHSNRELAMNSIWAIRNLSYLCTLKIKQDIINGLTIDRIYSMLEECIDKQFLLCLLTLLRNLFTEKDREILLPMFDTNRLLTTLKTLLDKNHPEEINDEVNLLLDYLNSSSESYSSPESIDSTYRISFRPEDEFYDMDHLDCSQI